MCDCQLLCLCAVYPSKNGSLWFQNTYFLFALFTFVRSNYGPPVVPTVLPVLRPKVEPSVEAKWSSALYDLEKMDIWP